ncbi:MAG: Crp/Fnr family transcriptional regulator [Bacteroidia bacterium]|nr:Crp/Fnr family transcriptional regulator [Bacteroidia bacterium]
MVDFQNFVSTRFSFLTEQDLQQVAEILELKQLKAGEVFIREGDLTYKLALVLEGLLRNFHFTENGDEKTVLFSWEGEIVGGYNCIFHNQPAKENVEALEPTTMVVINYHDFTKLTQKNPRLLQAHLTFLEQAFVEAIKRIDDFTLNSPEERYIRLLKEKPFLLQRVPQKHLASFLGITHISLSRIRKRISTKK